MSRHPSDPDYLFSILKLNKWFALSSIALALASFGMVKKDYDREWKKWQRQFRKLELTKTDEAIAKAKLDLSNDPTFREATAALEAAQKEYKKNEITLRDLRKKSERMEARRYAENSTYLELKADFDALRYELEEARAHKSADLKKVQKRYDTIRAKSNSARMLLEKSEANLNESKRAIDVYLADKKKADDTLTLLNTSLSRLDRKRRNYAHNFVNDVFRDIPLLDFIDPTLKVKEIVVRDLFDDYNFAKVFRADGCPTCHVAIDKEGYENEANPLKTHPKLDIFLAAKSKHSIDDFGCTVCHLGLGGGLTFTTAAHTPQNEKQEAEWKKKYGWYRMHDWRDPMLSLPRTEATCYGCHSKDVEIPKGEKINAGIELIERYGCYGCHKIEGWDWARKTGPSLKKISGKVSHDWLYQWIRNPKLFRPTTNMPQFFDLANTSDEKSKTRGTAELQAIVTYLLEKSESYDPGDLALPKGDSDRGKELFSRTGCLGCHSIDDFPNELEPRKVAPDLSKAGSKLSERWLAAWLKDPRKYWPQTRMPDLRLSPQEIADLVSYLRSKRDPAFETLNPPDEKSHQISAVTLDYLKARMPIQDARARLKAMSEKEQALYLGEKAIAHYGCFGCHEISGFEEAKPIGTELTTEASKPLSQFDFGMVPIEHTVDSFLYQKIMSPRIFDDGRIRDPLEKLKMPNFHLTPEEGRALQTFLLGLRKYEIPSHRKPAHDGLRMARSEGRKLAVHFNCRGCHVIEGQGGQVLAHYEDPSLGPPNLMGEGQKIQPDWLFHFLKNPTTIRPWLSVRMPTFGFTDDQANALVAYFRALDGLASKIELTSDVALSPEARKFGKEAFDGLKCVSCHVVGKVAAGRDTSNLAPDFTLGRKRLRYEWIQEWLKDPQKLLTGTRMPNFFFYEGQAMYPDADARIAAVRDYLWELK